MSKIKMSGKEYNEIIMEELSTLLEEEELRPADLRQKLTEAIAGLQGHTQIFQGILQLKSLEGNNVNTQEVSSLIEKHNAYITALEGVKRGL